MKTFIRLLQAAFSLATMTITAQVVNIPDPGLNAAIRQALGKPTGEITVADMEGLTGLDASRRARAYDAPLILSLEGLQTARNLVRIDLSGEINEDWGFPNLATSDFSFLAGLPALSTLNLSFNDQVTLALPKGFTNLQTLVLVDNQLARLTLPAGLTSLEELNLGNNRLTNFAFLSGLTSLQTLNLWDNQLTSVTLPAGLTNLARLYLGGNRLTNFAFLSGLTGLQTLCLDYNQLTYLILPEGLTQLQTLDLQGNQLTSLTLPTGLTTLQMLYVGRAGLLPSLHHHGHGPGLVDLGAAFLVSALSRQRELSAGLRAAVSAG
jgi:internalin A